MRRPPAPALLAFLLALSLLAPRAALPCVGRKLVIGALESDRQALASRVLSILIHERTGTTVEVRFFPGEGDLFEAARKGKVDLYVGYAGLSLGHLSGAAPVPDPEAAYALVKRRFDEEFNLVWGKPMGFSGRSPRGEDWGWGAPVMGKDTLKKFPALPRLLEKIGTKVILDDAVLSTLIERARTGGEEEASRAFLKEVKLI